MDLIEYRECYVRVDYNEDDRAELRRIIIVGNKIPDGAEWNREIEDQGICYLTPKRMPHRHIGESINDEIDDLSATKTVLERNLLDNTYGLINAEYIVNENVNLDDFLTTKPLGVKRVEGRGAVDGSVRAIEKPNILDKVLPVIGYFDDAMDKRSGVKPGTMGLDPNELQEVRQDVYSQNLSQGSTKIELIARLFAEQGVKKLIQKVHRLCRNYQVQQDIVKLKGSYVPVDPREWKERDDMTVQVGLGTGTEEARMKRAGMLAQAQERLGQFGLVGPTQAYNAFVDTVDSLDYPSASKYALDPSSEEYQQMMQAKSQQPQANPLAEVEMIKQQSAKEIAQMKEMSANQRKQAELIAKQNNEKLMLEDEQKRNALLAEKAENSIKEKAIKLSYDEEVFALQQQVAAIEEGYRDTITSAQEQVANIQVSAEESRLNDRQEHLEKIDELRQVMQELKEKSNLDAENRQGAIDLLINELNKPRSVQTDEDGKIIGVA